jgi:hypothetical protein
MRGERGHTINDHWRRQLHGPSSTLVSQVALTVFSSLVLSVFGQVSGRITTARDRTAFMLPGLFAVELVQCMLFADMTIEKWNFSLLP